MNYELANAIKNNMNRLGFTAAAEDFVSRARFYTDRELERIGRSWGV